MVETKVFLIVFVRPAALPLFHCYACYLFASVSFVTIKYTILCADENICLKNRERTREKNTIYWD